MKRELLRIILAIGFAWLGLLLVSGGPPDEAGSGDHATSRGSER